MCGHIFNYVAGPFLCPHCREKMEAKFQEVKEYIRNNPGVSIQDVSENCDVEPSQIQQWLREERLELTEGSSILLNCDLQSVLPKKPTAPQQSPRTSRDGERMRFL